MFDDGKENARKATLHLRYIFSTFLCRQCTKFEVNCLISGFMEGAKANDDEFSFRFLNVEMVVRNSTTGEIGKF